MSAIEGLVKDLEAKGLELWCEGERLHYRGPKEILTPQILTELKQHKTRIRTLLTESTQDPIVYPLSYNQRSLWFLHQLAPESAAYNVGFAVRVRSKIDVAALHRAIQELTTRHATLRTTFTKRGLEPVQVISRHQQVCLEQINAVQWDWPTLTAEVSAAYKRPFNLEDGPLMRVNLFTRGEDDHVLLLAVHHIVCDAWSLWLLLDELRVFYSARQQPDRPNAPTRPRAYGDYIRWQNEMLASSEGERLWDYWRRQLADASQVLNLLSDRPRPPVQTYNGSSHPFRLSAHVTERLRNLSKAEGVTMFMTLAAAFQVLLYRYSGQEDILLGSPTTGRSQADFVGIVGDFMNSVVLRSSFAGNPSFKAFLAQVRQTVLDALAHQDFPFPLLVERLQLDRDPSRSPIFQVMFNLLKPQQFPEVVELWVAGEAGKRVEWGGLSLEPFTFAQQEGQLDLTLEMVEGQASLFGVLKYNADLFDPETIERMAGHFETLLHGIVAHPEHRVSTLPLLTERERQQICVQWNQTQAEYPRDKCIHQLFEDQVNRTPDAIAVVHKDQHLTYRQLNSKADALALRLREIGVGLEALAGLCVDRSPEMLVGLLGILKAGAAYLPLDPDHPQKRLELILNDAHATVLVTQPGLLAKLPLDSTCSRSTARGVKVNDAEGSALSILSLEGPKVGHQYKGGYGQPGAAQPENVAYVMYTSGSTGTPKGVQVPHRAVVNFLTSMAREPGMTENDTMLAVTTLSFDIAGLELLLPLTVGGRVVIAEREVVIDGWRLASLLSDSGTTIMQATPATWRLLIESGWQGAPNMKILCGGEALSPELAQELLPRCSSLWNMYGPTETTIWSTICQVTSTARVTLGRPIANTEAYVLTEDAQPVPIGVPGELYLGGEGLANGYLHRPDLTAQRFVPHLFSNTSGARLYRTGDIVAYDPDGQIKYIGRSDYQVKIRGYRIELGEVEAVIRRHVAVKEVVVLAKGGASGEKQLVAYIVADKERPFTVAALRDFLHEQLPDYMVPSRFVILEKFPLTPNGKIDRNALPAHDRCAPEPNAAILPHTPTEELLLQIWSTVLGSVGTSVETNLFHSGGHSLTCVQLSAEIYKQLAIRLPVATFFQHPTIRELGKVLDAMSGKLPSSNGSADIAKQGMAEQDGAKENEPGNKPPSHNLDTLGSPDDKENQLEREKLSGGIKNRVLQLLARVAPLTLRPTLHRWRGVKIGANVYIGYDSIIETAYPRLVSIGNDAGIGIRTTIIGHFGGMEIASLKRGAFSVEIGDKAWVGPCVLILPNVKIGDGAVVAAGSTVTASIPAGTFAQGNPAKPLARCGMPLVQGVSYAEFIEHLKPLEEAVV